MNQTMKEYPQAFLLEPTKLNRILDTIHQRLADHSIAIHDSFGVSLTGGRHEDLPALNQVLALDNSRRYKITRLVILCSVSTNNAPRPEHEVQVDFASPKPTGTSGTTRVVVVTVRSDNAGWAARALSEVEEQVERTWLPHARPLVVLSSLLLAVLVLLASQFVRVVPGAFSSYLSDSEFDRVSTMLTQRAILTDEDLREVSTMQLRNLVDAHRPLWSGQGDRKRHTLVLALPLSALLVCIVILLTTCYPRAVFLWGDGVGRFENTMQRRRVIWGIVIGVTTVGVLSRFFYEGLSSWFTRL